MSETNKITITRALTELKTLDDRILNEINDLNALDVTQGKYKGKALKTNLTIDEFSSGVNSKMQKINDLINRKNNLKKAILKSNANKTVKIGNSEMTVAEAIEQKRSIQLKQNLLSNLKRQYSNKLTEIERGRASLESQLENMLSQNLGKDRKADAADYDRIAKPFIEANEITLVDPIGVKNVIDGLEEEIGTFVADVDIVLSESNSQTTIEV